MEEPSGSTVLSVITVSRHLLCRSRTHLVVDSRRRAIHQSCNPCPFLASNSYGQSRFDTSYLYRICHPGVLVSRREGSVSTPDNSSTSGYGRLAKSDLLPLTGYRKNPLSQKGKSSIECRWF